MNQADERAARLRQFDVITSQILEKDLDPTALRQQVTRLITTYRRRLKRQRRAAARANSPDQPQPLPRACTQNAE